VKTKRFYSQKTHVLKSSLGTVAWWLTMLVAGAIFLYPFWWMITSSFKDIYEIFAFPPTLLPRVWKWENYAEVFTFQPFARHYLNSVYIALLVMLGTLLISSLAGYGFARIRFPGRSFLFVMLLSGLMMPQEVTIVPNFMIMRTFHLTNTHVPLIIIPILGTGGILGTFMMRQYFLGLPHELEDAAMIDGLTRFGIFARIALPVARPALAAVAILTFLASWNAFLEPLIYIDDLAKFTLPLSLRGFTDQYGQPVWNIQLAATVLAVLPVLLLYVLAQRQVVESLSRSGTKG
jgi:multiple sugar transport system permease protein